MFIMGMGFQEIIVVLMSVFGFGGSSGNELLDFVDGDIYFESKKVEMTVASLMAEVKKPKITDESYAKEASVRRLLAMRELGRLKDKKALPLLKEFLDSKVLFEADYAADAIARIEGKPLPVRKDQQAWKKNVNLFPKDTGVLGYLKLARLKAKPGIMKRALAMMKSMDEVDDEDMADMRDEIKEGLVEEFFPVIEQLGNMRIDSITFGVAGGMNDDNGWVTAVVKGSYDSKALANFIDQEMGEDVELKQVAGANYMILDEDAAIGLVNDHTFVFSVGAEGNKSYETLQKAMFADAPKAEYSKTLADLVNKVDKKGNVWVAGIVDGAMKDVPMLKEFETFMLETELKEKSMVARVVAGGKDEATVQKTMDALEKQYLQFVENMLPEMKEDMPEQMKPIADALGAVKFRVRGKEGIISIEMPEFDPINMMGLLMMGGAAGGVEPAPAPVPVPAPIPVP